MLTIKPPIRLTTQRFTGMLQPDLAEKIRGNYQLLRPGIRTEELLHVTASTPEIYFAEGGGLQIQNQIHTENQQEFRLEVINHLMNRILISGTQNFRYQDSVYVSSVLRRLGIRNERYFLHLVQQLQEEKRENKKLTALYEENRNLLSVLIQEETAQANEQVSKEDTTQTSGNRPDYFLQEEIYKRLHTSQIYQDMKSFSGGIQNMALRIYQAEFQMAEQANLIQNFHLQEVKQHIFQKEQPLYYYHTNEYELAGEEEGTVEAARDRLSAALLLNLVDQAYTLRLEQIEENSHHWYSVAGALFQTMENTWQRYSAYHQEQRMAGRNFYEIQLQTNQERKQEQHIVEQIAQKLYQFDTLWQEKKETYLDYQNQQLYQGETQTEIQLSGGAYHGTPEAIQLSYPSEEMDTGAEEEEEKPLTAERLQEQLAVFNQKNLENLKKITEITTRKLPAAKKTLNREKAKQDLLRAMEHPEEVLTEYLMSEQVTHSEEVQERLEQEVYNLFSEETKEIYRRYLEQREGQNIPLFYQKTEEPTKLSDSLENGEELPVIKQTERILEVKERIQEVLTRLESQTERTEQEERVREALRQELIQLQNGTERAYQREQREVQEEAAKLIYREAETGAEAAQSQRTESSASQTEQGQTKTSELVREVRERIREEHDRQTERETAGGLFQIVGKELVRELTQIQEQTPLNLYQRYVPENEERENRSDPQTGNSKESALGQRAEQIPQELPLAEPFFIQQTEPSVGTILTESPLPRSGISLIHREEERQISEELLETIRQRTQAVVREEHQEERTIQKNSVTETTLQEASHQIRIEQTENLEELIRQKFQQNLGRISDQVYGRIEKRLQTERKRRGF